MDLIYNFFIPWGKRPDIHDNKFESLPTEYQKLTKKYHRLNNKIDIILHKLEEAKGRQWVCKNNDYIKEEVISIGKNLSKISICKEFPSETRPEILEVKKLAQEIKTLIIS